MTSHYRLPVLLIEFDHDKAFALQASLSAASPYSIIACACCSIQKTLSRTVAKQFNKGLFDCCLYVCAAVHADESQSTTCINQRALL